MNCKICNLKVASIASLSNHVRYFHHMEVKDYYDLHVKREKEGSCIICENDTRYIDLRIGYRDTCGHKCACTMHRRNLKKDKRKFNKFAKKVKINQTKIWKTMDKNEKDRIFGKIALTNKIKIAKPIALSHAAKVKINKEKSIPTKSSKYTAKITKFKLTLNNTNSMHIRIIRIFFLLDKIPKIPVKKSIIFAIN